MNISTLLLYYSRALHMTNSYQCVVLALVRRCRPTPADSVDHDRQCRRCSHTCRARNSSHSHSKSNTLPRAVKSSPTRHSLKPKTKKQSLPVSALPATKETPETKSTDIRSDPDRVCEPWANVATELCLDGDTMMGFRPQRPINYACRLRQVHIVMCAQSGRLPMPRSSTRTSEC